ncbi:short-chain dehydrogenase [Colletotrichum truncatum]|uniref:Short-chain dehydrogenase n=1 Tax=Colletotrichum truncatum TaxID=5467 RepID=A0ACC3ZE31_COLTU|nr:short-chain dehydrogenase [Colletotrichum truncatum]KAF6794732.1 short-chain dehydrogenase [Colletotrichum truncatum]
MYHSPAIILAAAGLASAFTNTKVEFFMRKNIDPIVIPGQYKSHMHSFFGSDAVNVNLSTTAELQEGCATAQNPNDLSVYWIPTLYHVEGSKRTPIEPVSFTAYYNFDKDPAEVPIPPNFNVVAGNAEAKTEKDLIEGSDIAWLCQNQKFDAGGKANSQFPQSTCSTSLQSVLWFPDCVDSKTLKSAYSNKGSCPDGMKRMPQLRFSIRYDTKKAIPGGWKGEPPLELACGPSYCFHGDFVNGWLQESAEKMVTALTSKRSWQAIDGPNGKSKAGPKCKKGSAKDSDPENGTSDYAESVKAMAKRRVSMKKRIGM